MTCLSGRAFRCGRGNARLFPDAGSFPLLGFPLYSAKRALATLAGMAVAPLRGEADRCLHLLTLSQLRGEWAERRRMVAERVAGARRFPAWKAVSQVLERRGLLGTLLIPVRWLLSPLARWEQLQFFEWRSQEPPLELPRLDGVDFAVFHGTDQSRSARVALCPLEKLKPEEIDQRLQNGDSVVVAWLRGRAVGYAWNTYSDLHVPEIGAVVRLDPLEALGYDGYVSNEFRGMGVLPHLDRWLMKDMVQRGRKRQLIYADTRNRAILRSLKRAGKRKVFRVWRLRVPWLGLDTGPRSSEASVSCHDAMSKKLGRAAS